MAVLSKPESTEGVGIRGLVRPIAFQFGLRRSWVGGGLRSALEAPSWPAVSLVFLLAGGGDPRRSQARRQVWEAILLIATLAVICGADNGIEVEFFGPQKQAWPEIFLDLPHGIPSHDTFGRVFGLRHPARLEACFAAWVQSLAATLRDGIVAAGNVRSPA